MNVMALALRLSGQTGKARQLDRARAYTLIDVIVFLICLGVLAAVAVLPSLAKAKCSSCRTYCGNNLKQTGLGFKCWAIDHKDNYPMQVPISQGGTMELATNGQAWVHFIVLSNELNNAKVLFCPEEKVKTRFPPIASAILQFPVWFNSPTTTTSAISWD